MDVEFVGAADMPGSYPRLGLAEVAFAGRSNVGKSSLINTLIQRHGLVRTSKDPGRTRLLGFIRVERRVVLVDLPGYGYAKVSKAERGHWRDMVESYLATREELALVCLLVDCRRDPQETELLFVQWLNEHAIPVTIVVTKIDKLGRSERAKRLRLIARSLGLAVGELIAFSAQSGEGKTALWSKLEAARTARQPRLQGLVP